MVLPPQNTPESDSPTGETPTHETLAGVPLKRDFVVARVDGERGFRRRLLELGLVPGTHVRVERVAPLGDPLEISLRGSRLSIRRHEAALVQVDPAQAEAA